MATGFIGEIRLFGFDFAPRFWALCQGQLLPISQNTALFSILGTTYGGNGSTTFSLPDLQGRAALHAGQGPGQPNYVLGQRSGSESVALNATQIPAHTHAARASSGAANIGSPVNANWVAGSTNYLPTSDASRMNSASMAMAGGNQPHENRAPSLVLNYSIALSGIFPSRN